jgi:cobalt-zinc-cadmium efflux system outer membrane protein
MFSRKSRQQIALCAVGLLVAGCQSSNRWTANRQESRSSRIDAIATNDVQIATRVSAASEPVDEITLTSGEQLEHQSEIVTPAQAVGTAANASLSLAYLEQLALENNPAIRQASASASKAAGFRDQVGRYANPTIGYSGQQLGDAGTDQHMLTLSQDIITGNKLGLNQHVLNQSVQAQLWEVEAQRQRVLTDVRTSYYEALAAQRRLALATEFQVVAAKGVRVAQSRKDALEGSQPEILQAEILLQEIELQQQQTRNELTAAWKELTATVGLPDLSLDTLEGELPTTAEARDWNATYEELASRSPELRAARSRVDRASANLCRQDAQVIPNLELQLGVGRDLGTGSDFAQVGVGVPLPVFNRNEGNISAAHAEYCRATQDYQRLRMSLKARLARAAKEHDSALAAVQRYQGQILPKAQQSLTMSEQAYAAAEFNFLQVLTARRTFFESNIRAVDARRQLAQANTLIDGMLLSGGLSDTVDTTEDDGLRGQALSGQ